MSFQASYDTKQRIKQAVDIVDLVNSYLPLRREGRGFKALCPWHDDSRPSLQVNAERQSFKCWVCDIGGDVFSFVMKMENLEFREALEMLAERAGVTLRKSEPGSPLPRSEDDKRGAGVLKHANRFALSAIGINLCLPVRQPDGDRRQANHQQPQAETHHDPRPCEASQQPTRRPRACRTRGARAAPIGRWPRRPPMGSRLMRPPQFSEQALPVLIRRQTWMRFSPRQSPAE